MSLLYDAIARPIKRIKLFSIIKESSEERDQRVKFCCAHWSRIYIYWLEILIALARSIIAKKRYFIFETVPN